MLEDDLIRKRTGKPLVFFLQPNQYLKGSKSFSEQEKRIAIDPHRLEDTNEMMVLLKVAAQDLRDSGVPIFDLTGIFSSTDDTVYKDDCCHLNNLGNQIMADAVVSKIILNQSGGGRKSSIH
jgi:lysophospholipase L1-like esterase